MCQKSVLQELPCTQHIRRKYLSTAGRWWPPTTKISPTHLPRELEIKKQGNKSAPFSTEKSVPRIWTPRLMHNTQAKHRYTNVLWGNGGDTYIPTPHFFLKPTTNHYREFKVQSYSSVIAVLYISAVLDNVHTYTYSTAEYWEPPYLPKLWP